MIHCGMSHELVTVFMVVMLGEGWNTEQNHLRRPTDCSKFHTLPFSYLGISKDVKVCVVESEPLNKTFVKVLKTRSNPKAQLSIITAACSSLNASYIRQNAQNQRQSKQASEDSVCDNSILNWVSIANHIYPVRYRLYTRQEVRLGLHFYFVTDETVTAPYIKGLQVVVISVC